jgi:hypothetical protein
MSEASLPNSDPSTKAITPGKAGITVFVNLAVGIFLFVAYWLGYEVLVTDILQENPHRSLSEALKMIPVFGLFLGLFLLFGYGFLAIVLAVIWAWYLVRRLGRLPFWPFLGAVPLYWLLIVFQYSLLSEFSWYTDHPDDLPGQGEAEVATKFTFVLLAILTFTWWQLRHRQAKIS